MWSFCLAGIGAIAESFVIVANKFNQSKWHIDTDNLHWYEWFDYFFSTIFAAAWLWLSFSMKNWKNLPQPNANVQRKNV